VIPRRDAPEFLGTSGVGQPRPAFEPRRDPLTDPLAWASKIGARVTFWVDGWHTTGQVVDVRLTYGRVHLDVQQDANQTRRRWIDAERVLQECRP